MHHQGPSLCAGRLFISWYVPAGEVEDQSYVERFNKEGKLDEERAAGKYKVAADDHFLCVDAATGETLWHRVLEGEGINYNHSAQGPLATPFATPERVFFFSTSGHLHCLDASSGETIWKAGLGPATEWLEQEREKCLAEGGMFNRFRQAGVFGHGPMLAGSVVVCSDNDYSRGQAGEHGSAGLVGIDAASGRLRWGPIQEAATYMASPLRWVHEGKVYIVSYSPTKMVLVDPADGRVLWEIEERWRAGTAALHPDGYIALHTLVGERKHNDGRLRCYRFNLKGAELAWEKESGGSRGKPPWGWGSLVISHDTVFGCFNSEDSPTGTWGGVDLTTGEVQLEFGLANRNDLHAAHGVLFNHTTPLARFDGERWQQLHDQKTKLSCMQYSLPIVAGGFFFSRGGDGHLRCYDLRRR